MRSTLMIGCAAMLCGAASATTITEDFESYSLGPLDQHAVPGGLTWRTVDAGGSGSAHTAQPGYLSAQSGRWEVEDVGIVSQGDDMYATFAAVGPRIVVEAMTYASLGIDPQYTGRRAARFEVLNDAVDAFGIGLEWNPSGLVGDTHGNLSNVQFVNGGWVPIRIELNYALNTYSLSYGASFVTSGALLARDGVSAQLLNISLATMALDESPNPNDAFLVDNIVITPEPASLAALLALLPAWRRR